VLKAHFGPKDVNLSFVAFFAFAAISLSFVFLNELNGRY